MVVKARFDLGNRSVAGDFLVPADAVIALSDSGVYLAEANSRLAQRPTFDEQQFVVPPPDWKPPFPFALSAVRWPPRA
jgi:hypothetical protein